MSNLNVFIASSLKQFEEEREYLKRHLSNITNVGSVYVCEYELPGEVGRVNDTQKELINTNLAESDLVIFLLGSKVGSKTVEEFDLAMSMRDRLHIFVLYNPDKPCSPEDGMPYDEFYREKMTDLVICQDGSAHYDERYVNVWKDNDKLLELAMRAVNHTAQNLLKTRPCPELSYDDFIPDTQSSRRNSCHHYFHRPEIDGELKACLTKYRFTLLSGPSTSGKTMAACRAIQELKDYQVYAVNSNVLDRELRRLYPENTPSIFNAGKIILLLDDVQDILWRYRTDGGEYVERIDREIIWRLMRVENPDFHIVATSYMDDVDQIKRFFGSNDSNSAYINIHPLSRKDLKAYADQLQAYGYMVKDGNHGMTLGSLFIDLDRIREDVANAMVNDMNDLTIGRATAQVCDAIKTIWMWKNNSRKDYGRFLKYLQFTYPEIWTEESRSLMDKVIRRLRGLVVYRGETFNVDEIIVESVFRFLRVGSVYDENKAAEAATERLFKFFLNAEYNDELGENNLFKNCTKTQQMSCRYDFGQTVRNKLHEHLSSTYDVKNVFLLKHEELSDNKVGEKVDWVKIFASNFIMMAKNDQIAYNIWNAEASDNVAGTLLLLKRLKDRKLRTLVYDRLSEADGCLKKNFFDPDKEYEGSMEYSLKMELCSFDSVDLETAKKVFEGLPSIMDVTKNEDSRKSFSFDDAYDDDSYEYVELDGTVEDSNAVTECTESLRFENMTPAQKVFAKMTRRMCHILMMKAVAWGDFSELVDYLIANGKGFIPADRNEFMFQYIDKYTWKQWIRSLGSDLRTKEVFVNILACEVEHNTGAVETPMYLKKKYILNSILDCSCEVTVLHLWPEMRAKGCFDSYTLHVLLSKVSDFGIAKGIFESFMETPGAKLVKVGEIVLNDLLNKTMTWSGIKECEQLFRNYGLIGKDDRITDVGFSEHTQGILHNQMTYDEIKEHLKKHRQEHNENSRSTATMIHLLLKAPDYQTSKDIVFGEWKDEWGITRHEQKVLRQSPYAVSLVFKNCRNENDGDDAKRLYEGLCNANVQEAVLFQAYDRRKKLIYIWNTEFYMRHPDGNILNEVINNDLIYPELEAKQKVVDLARQKGYTVNDYTEKHILLRSIKQEVGLDKKLAFIAGRVPESCGYLRVFLVGAMVEFVLKKTGSLSSTHIFPVFIDGEWRNVEMTVNEYVLQMFDEGYIEGYALYSILKYANDEESAAWQEAAVEKGIQLDYGKYQKLKAWTIRKPYVLVKDYALFKDVCYKLRHHEFTFEEAEEYIKEAENAMGVSIARTEIYWNVVISSISLAKNIGRREKWLKIKAFMTEKALLWNSERFYSALHVISSKDDFEELRGFYSKDMNVSQILAAVNQLKNEIETCKYKTQIANWFSSEFMKWYETLKKVDETTHDFVRLRDSVIDSLSDKTLELIQYKSNRYGQKRTYVQWSFMFYWIIGFALVRGRQQRKEMEDILCRQYLNYFGDSDAGLDSFMDCLSFAKNNGKYPYPDELMPEIQAIIRSRIM